MPPDLPCAAEALLGFNRQLLRQADALAAAHAVAGRPPYAEHAGPHLRHVIEHYEALLFPRRPGVVDYDARARDAHLEASPQEARRRLQALHAALEPGGLAAMGEPLQVLGACGLLGEHDVQADSSLGRELAFVASHAIHHFALLAGYCREHAIPTPDGFGRAPATRAHDLARHRPACA